MQSVKLFSYAKNIDLHAVSAQEAITSFMRYDRLVRLRRFQLAEFELDATDAQQAEGFVDSILSRTMDILNPNKEAYRYHTLARPKTAQNVEIFLVYVSPLFSSGEQRHVDRIKQKASVPLRSLERGVVWELHVKSVGKTKEELKEDVSRVLVMTESREKGLLCNPLFEKAVFLDTQAMYGNAN